MVPDQCMAARRISKTELKPQHRSIQVDRFIGLLTIDYWIVADTYAVPMHYDPHGRFLGAEIAPADQLADFAADPDRAWAAAEPFGTWWARHPEMHRQPVG